MGPKQANNNGVPPALKVIHNQLGNLKDAGALTEHQYESICAQLPGEDGSASDYIDPNYNSTGGYDPSSVAKSSQNADHPSHPNHPQHNTWAKKGGKKVGNAAMMGFGRSAGSALFNSVA